MRGIAILSVVVIISSIVGNMVRGTDVIGGTILSLILLLIPLIAIRFKSRDPVGYFGLDFKALSRIDVKTVFIIAVVLFSIISLLDWYPFHLWDRIFESDIMVGSTSVAMVKKGVFYLAPIVMPGGTLLEEVWFRGLIQYSLRRISLHLAVFVQSLLFGLVHFLPVYIATDFPVALKLWFFLYPFAIGMVLGYTNERYKSLLPGWIIHYTNNVLAVFLMAIMWRG